MAPQTIENMKISTHITRLFASLVVAASSALIFCQCAPSERTFVILSTNDMHAQVDKFPALATAVSNCRDTVDVILVDAGDRWTGNAFVDLVEHYTPIYELLNHLEYDVTIYGNHEFDKGQAYLAEANRQAKFPIIGANIKSDTTSFPQPAGHHIVELNGLKIGFVGVVGNYDGDNHPSGKSESYVGLSFSDPQEAAGEYGYLADECDMLVLVSHSGLERDMEFAASPLSEGYNQVISAHSHDVAIEQVGEVLVSQTGSRLKNVGATTVVINSKGEVKLSYKNIPLSEYEADATVAKMVEGYYDNPTLNAPIGAAAAPFDHNSISNLFAETIRQRTRSNIGIYHVGGVRIEEIKVGDISTATVLNAEPFGSLIATTMMNTAQLKALIMAKFNDTRNVGEAHCIDIIATTPYTILTDDEGEAVDVLFPNLDPKRSYSVAMGDYIFKTYAGLKYNSGKITEITITETLEEYIKKHSPLAPNSAVLQSIEKQEVVEQ